VTGLERTCTKVRMDAATIEHSNAIRQGGTNRSSIGRNMEPFNITECNSDLERETRRMRGCRLQPSNSAVEDVFNL
jgi:hypothetical protein